MAKSTNQDLSVLSSSKHGLLYLTPNDWTLVADKAARIRFSKGHTIVNKGKKTNGVFLLPGEICGEMSFLEDAPASVNVVAQGDVEAYQLDRATLEGLFEIFPHLASRFYRSLAANLSHRLRELIGPNATV